MGLEEKAVPFRPMALAMEHGLDIACNKAQEMVCTVDRLEESQRTLYLEGNGSSAGIAAARLNLISMKI